MARRKGSDLSVAQLERLLATAKKNVLVTTLSQKKASLQAEISSVDKELQTLQGPSAPAPRRRKKSRRRGKRPKNTQPLAAVVAGILGDASKGLGLDDLVAKVRASGYKTKAKSFTNVVYQCVYNAKAIYRDKKSGTYRMKPVEKKS